MKFGLSVVITIAIVIAISGTGLFSEEKNSPVPSHILPTPTPRFTEKTLPANVLLDVPFTAQAPLGNWDDPRQQDGCEEASLLMAYYWATGKTFSSLQAAEAAIIAFAEYQKENYGHSVDTSAADSAKLMQKYLQYDKVRVQYDITLQDIKRELAGGRLVIVPALGRELPNPNFTPPGPLRHMLVIIGYNNTTQQFITNDPGTRQGKGFRYDYSVMNNAFYDYPTGNHEVLIEKRRAMIVVEK